MPAALSATALLITCTVAAVTSAVTARAEELVLANNSTTTEEANLLMLARQPRPSRRGGRGFIRRGWPARGNDHDDPQDLEKGVLSGGAGAAADKVHCPPGWDYHSGACYYHSTWPVGDPLVHQSSYRAFHGDGCNSLPTAPGQPPRCLTYDQAEAQCAEFGYTVGRPVHLASIRSDGIHRYMLANAGTVSAFKYPMPNIVKAGSWIGLEKAQYNDVSAHGGLMPSKPSSMLDLSSGLGLDASGVGVLPPKDGNPERMRHQHIPDGYLSAHFTDGSRMDVEKCRAWFAWDKPDDSPGKRQCAAYGQGALDLFPCEFELPYTCSFSLVGKL